MAFDKSTRKRLENFVSEARTLISKEFTQQFQYIYGISEKGDVTLLEELGHLDDAGLSTATLLQERIEYLIRTHPGEKDGAKAAVDRLVREQAFTVLNRLAALRMAEKRDLIVESVGKGYQSKGFKVYEQVAGSGLGDTYCRYRRYLFCLFDELAVDLGVLFDRSSPQGLLFPREPALLELLNLLNAPELDALWAEDETIGWIYQYYNDPAERKKMRDESAAPRNSRELAVRNQFFTPRYVVEFLTDNTLGRIWYEMTDGETGLKEQCRYLVRRPTEIFLKSGEAEPETAPRNGLSQEDLLRQAVYIAHRSLKDPRNIRMLDPACGSMHFGLYAFDLFEVIYDEAWDIAHGNDEARKLSDSFASFVSFVAKYPDKAAFLADIPRLIIERNIHGIDIDSRCAQIAGLSLWLRAQKSWQSQKVSVTERPRIRKSNIVCAEPMPGDKAMLREFVQNQFSTSEQPAFSRLLETIFDKMQLAGEAGSLLKIEEEIRSAVEEARKLWEKDQTKPRELFSTEEINRTLRPGAPQKLAGLEQAVSQVAKDFWETAEERIYAALREYAEQAENGGGFQRRLFADDAARGFAFIDVSRRRYDVALKNPPFGEPSASSRKYLYSAYESAKKDIFAAFVDWAIQIADSVGVITSRTCFFLAGFESWRLALTEGPKRLSVLADLADGVLDAMVEAAAYCILGTAQNEGAFFRVTDTNNKAEALLSGCSAWSVGKRNENSFIGNFDTFDRVPTSPFAYWLSADEANLFGNFGGLESQWGDVIRGPEVPDLDRAARCWWEVDPISIGETHRWVWYAKGGEFKRFAHDVHLVVDFKGALTGSCPFRRPGDIERYFHSGITYSQRTTKPISFRVLPAGCLTSPKGPAILPKICGSTTALMGIVNSKLFSSLVNSRVGAAGAAARSYDLGILRQVPLPHASEQLVREIKTFSEQALGRGTRENRANETSPDFVFAGLAFTKAGHIRELAELVNDSAREAQTVYNKSRSAIEQLLLNAFSIKVVGDTSSTDEIVFTESKPSEITESLVSYIFGCTLGRWDIRYTTGEKEASEAPDPFAPLPVCPPGQLQNAQGFPARPEDVPASYPIRIPWDGILVDDPNHPLDIERRIREVFEIIWKDRAEVIEHEACEILGVKSLRDYLRKPAGFFADHLKCYSKSRRQAPIYCPLSTASGRYTLWIYYHRLNENTLHAALADFINPKLKSVRDEISYLRNGGNQQARLEEFMDLEREIEEFRAEIERIIKLPWKPNFNDGVLINTSPLWKLFRLPKWQKDLKACWEELSKGEYDWAYLAYTIWPDRVKELCKTDRSIAIAHGLEHLCKVEAPKPKGKRKKAKDARFEDLEV